MMMDSPHGPTRNAPHIFISSTVEDLRPWRDAARDAVIQAGMFPRMMEYFAASGDRPPLDRCLKEVSGTDAVIVVVAHRHGWVPPDQPGRDRKSITRLECEHAIACGREVLAFPLDEKHPWPPELREEQRIADAVRRNEATPELLESVQRDVTSLRELRDWLNGCVVLSSFTTPEDLRGKVYQALIEWRSRTVSPPFSGPGLAASVPDVAAPSDPTLYLRALREASATLEIRGLQVGTGKAHRFPIEELYMTLTAAGGTSDGLDESKKRHKKKGPGEDRPAGRPAEAGP